MERDNADREFNLNDIFWATCLKWRYILVCAVIFAILAAGYSYIKNARTAQELAEKITVTNMVLEENSQQNVKDYLEHMRVYEDQIRYNDGAALMQLDAAEFYRSVLTYYVDNHFAVEYPLMSKVNNVDAMIEMYKAGIRKEEFATKFRALMGNDENTALYGMELVDCSNRFGDSSIQMTATAGVFRISIYGNNEQECMGLAELVKASIEAEKQVVTEKFGEHTLTLVENNCSLVSDIDLLRYQQENIAKSTGYAAGIRDLQTKLTEEEISYIETYKKEMSKDESEEVLEDTTEAVSVTISKKIVVVGFIGGAALAFFVMMLLYLLNGRLRLEDDFETIFRIRLLGNVLLESKRKKKWFAFIDNFFNKMRHFNKHYFLEKEAISMAATNIKIGAKKLGATKVFITGASVEKEECSVIEKVKDELKITGIELVIGKPILYDAEALEKAAEIGVVVLIEHAGASLYSEVNQEIEICAHQGTKVLGAIVVA